MPFPGFWTPGHTIAHHHKAIIARLVFGTLLHVGNKILHIWWFHCGALHPGIRRASKQTNVNAKLILECAHLQINMCAQNKQPVIFVPVSGHCRAHNCTLANPFKTIQKIQHNSSLCHVIPNSNHLQQVKFCSQSVSCSFVSYVD